MRRPNHKSWNEELIFQISDGEFMIIPLSLKIYSSCTWDWEPSIATDNFQRQSATWWNEWSGIIFDYQDDGVRRRLICHVAYPVERSASWIRKTLKEGIIMKF